MPRRTDPYRDRQYRKRRERLLRQSDVCYLCGQPGATTVDHVIPLAKGGTNDISNLRPCCMTCNMRKGKKLHAPIVRRSGSLD